MTHDEYMRRAMVAYGTGAITLETYEVLTANADIFTTSTKGQPRIEARHRKFQGFGEEHTNAEWARLLGLPRNTLWRNLQQGRTVEEIAQMRGIKYPA